MRPTRPYQAPFIIDTSFSLVIIAGYFLIHTYCQYLFLGPCNTSGQNFPIGLALILTGSIGLGAFRIHRAKTRVILARILVFTEGTIIKEERGEDGRMVSGIMLGNAAGKLREWRRQGARITYLTSRRATGEVEVVRRVLKRYKFPRGELFYRLPGEEYGNVAERVMPDVTVEDDCAGIGGEAEMTYPHIRPDLKQRIKSVVVREFGGIDHLPDNVSDLLRS